MSVDLRVEPGRLIDVAGRLIGHVVDFGLMDVEPAESHGAGARRRDAVHHGRVGVAQAHRAVLGANSHGGQEEVWVEALVVDAQQCDAQCERSELTDQGRVVEPESFVAL